MPAERASRRGVAVRAAIGVAAAVGLLVGSASSQEAGPKQQARVPTSHANIHKGPSSGQVVLLLAPEGTVLPVLSRRGEWVEVGLAPELRKTCMLMRWYEDEKSGWMHDSTGEITDLGEVLREIS